MKRLPAGDVARAFFERLAGQKSFRRKDQPPTPPDDPGNPTVNFHGERRSNTTQQSTTYPDSRLFKKAKGHEAKLGYLGEVLMENRHGLVVDACVVPATGTDERDAAASSGSSTTSAALR